MNSMTGYGSARAALGRLEVTVQASSVNRKTLDLAISVPEDWRSLEADIAERVRQRAARGRISLTVKADLPGDSGGAAIDADFVTKTVAELARIAGTQSVEFRATPELLWSIAVSQRGRIELPDAEVAGPVVSAAVDEALKGFFAMRAQEGKALLADLVARVDAVAKAVADITAAVPRVVPAYRELLLARLRQAGLELELSDERVLKEVAIFADRCDVSEELTRLQSHLAQLRTLLAEDGAVGRKAEFIMQEVGRELNT
ncbi:MAG TPA: DUF1732 domain-containing protein, partial [Opitutaceae bacterium]|nr:DUF1732 domain-containing protein [Opitutaceae bacterium]